MTSFIRGIAYSLPEGRRSNEELTTFIDATDPEKIYNKTGIKTRSVVAENQTATDLGCTAAESLLEELQFDRSAIDALVFCTQSPDYFLPTSACLLHNRLDLPTSCGAFDVNLGCSGFTYGLWLAKSFIDSGNAQSVLLVTADTYSKYCDPSDLATATIFGDAGAACLISNQPEQALAEVGETVVGTDGRGAKNLIVEVGAARAPVTPSSGPPRLYMNGPEIFSFTLSTVRAGIQELLSRCQLGWEDIDTFLFHQANRFMLEKLRDSMGIPPEKMPIDFEDTGNTVSASIPVLMRRCLDKNLLRAGTRCVLVGFGVGYSWAMTLLTIQDLPSP